MEPIRNEIRSDPLQLVPEAARSVRRASDLRGIFENASALAALIRAGDPVVYETYEPPIPAHPGHLAHGVTIIYPGRVGDEYFMTRGHFHLRRQSAEVYLTLRGQGALVLQDESGRWRVEPLHPGTVVYVPPGWAHRSVNTGDSPLLLLYVYPADAGHDYEAVARMGFRVRLMAVDGKPQVVPVQE